MCLSYRFWRTRERIKDNSPHGRRPGWAVTPIIVKSGDDCRQELLAAQLIDAFYDIFQVCTRCPWQLCTICVANRAGGSEKAPANTGIWGDFGNTRLIL